MNGNTPNIQPVPKQPRRNSRDQISFLANSFSIFETIKSNSIESISEVDTRDAHTIRVTTRVPLLEAIEDDEDLTVDLSSVTTKEDFKRLWASDPFLYYSIPEIHRRSYKVSEDDSDDDEDELGVTSPAVTSPAGLFPPKARQAPAAAAVTVAVAHPQEQAQAQEHQQRLNDVGEEHRPARRRSSTTSRNMSCPAGMLANADISYSIFHGGTAIVTRCRRLSTEAHPSLVVDDAWSTFNDDYLTDDDDDSLYDSDDDSFDEPLKRALTRMNSIKVHRHDELE